MIQDTGEDAGWWTPTPVNGLVAAFEAMADPTMTYSEDQLVRILASLREADARMRAHFALAAHQGVSDDAASLRAAAEVLKRRFGVLTAGDLIAALGKAVSTIEETR
jgi:hypothetical protein